MLQPLLVSSDFARSSHCQPLNAPFCRILHGHGQDGDDDGDGNDDDDDHGDDDDGKSWSATLRTLSSPLTVILLVSEDLIIFSNNTSLLMSDGFIIINVELW